VSCTDFFSTSWAEDGKRDISKINVDASNVDGLLKAARGYPDMSLTILDKIAERIDGASQNDKSKLREAALKAAAQGTDIASMLISNVNKFTSQNGLDVLLDAIAGSADAGRIRRATGDLLEILPPIDDSTLEFTEDFAATEAELVQTALLVILGEVGKTGGTVQDYLDGWTTGKKLDGTGSVTLSPEEKLLAALVNRAAGGSNGLGNQIKDLLE
jgi:hypothetical protein